MAALLSAFVIPGAGQLYNGQRAKAFLFAGIELGLIALFAALAVSYFSGYMIRAAMGDAPPVPAWEATVVDHVGAMIALYVLNRIASVADAHRAARRLMNVPRARMDG
jgi:hypothetical protein